MTLGKETDHGACAVCGGSLAPGKTTIPFVRGARVLTIRDIPADICGDCGEAYLLGETVDRVQEQVGRLEALDAEVSIARYHAA